MSLRWLIVRICCVVSAWASGAEPSYTLQPRQIADGTWLLEGSTDNFATSNGGNSVNTAFIVTDTGVVVIDTGPSRRYGEAMRKAIAAITDKPVIQVLLTHHHPDHVLGNQAFVDVPIGALAGTTTLMREQGDMLAQNMYRLVGDWMRGTEIHLPDQTLSDGTLNIGGHPLRLLALAGHTGADLAILDERTGVLFAGDIVFYERSLTTPNTPGLEVWLKDVDTLGTLPWKILVPGHGPIATDQKPFAQMRDYLTWLDALMRDGAAHGSDMAEMIRSPIPERFASISLTRYELIRSVSHLYPRYERVQMGRLADSPGR
jgi:quinoprotein relay system zinc metallohydrolase 1